MSQAYLQKKQVNEALSPLLTGFKIAKQQGRKEKENWYALLQYIYNDRQDFNNQEKALEVLVDRWPKAQWWLALGGVYAQQEKELKQLYAMDAAYQQGLFSRGEYIVSMSQLLAMQGAPYYAAKAMNKGLDDGLVEPSFKNHRRLGSYYQRAQEQTLALKYFQKASAQADDGEISLRIAYVYMNQYDYPNAEKFIQKALAQGSLQNTTKAQLLLGEVQFHRQKFDNAISQFDRVLVANKNYTDEKNVLIKRKNAILSRLSAGFGMLKTSSLNSKNWPFG
jgi:tetratricopeptide (TPR) repeat protein